MFDINLRFAARAVYVVAIAALALVAVSCGSDSDADSSASDEKDVAALIKTVQTAYETKDGAAYCAVTVPELQKAVTAAIQADTCKAAFDDYLSRAVAKGDVYPTDLEYKFDGDRASVTGYMKHTDSRQRAFFRRDDGEWRIAAWFRGDDKDEIPWLKGWRADFQAQ